MTDYLNKAGLTKYLDQPVYKTVGYGCTTCIGNSGPLPEPVAKAVTAVDLVASACSLAIAISKVRVNRTSKQLLASHRWSLLMLAGSTAIDLTTEPLGTGKDANRFPERSLANRRTRRQDDGRMRAARDVRQPLHRVWESNPNGNAIPVSGGMLYDWKADSTYIQEPPFLIDLAATPSPITSIKGARCLPRSAIGH